MGTDCLFDIFLCANLISLAVFMYLRFNVAFNTVSVLSQHTVLLAEETSTSVGQGSANYQ